MDNRIPVFTIPRSAIEPLTAKRVRLDEKFDGGTRAVDKIFIKEGFNLEELGSSSVDIKRLKKELENLKTRRSVNRKKS